MTALRDAIKSDFASIVRLNEVEVQQTSPMDLDRLRFLVQMSSYFKVATVESVVAAFLLGFREGAAYENDNYKWFSTRFSSFLYIDRIVVGSDFSGRRIGSMLYTDLFEFARSHGVDTVTCEYNIVPPNPASRSFHNKFGFRELGTQWLARGTKQVSLQVAQAGGWRDARRAFVETTKEVNVDKVP